MVINPINLLPAMQWVFQRRKRYEGNQFHQKLLSQACKTCCVATGVGFYLRRLRAVESLWSTPKQDLHRSGRAGRLPRLESQTAAEDCDWVVMSSRHCSLRGDIDHASYSSRLLASMWLGRADNVPERAALIHHLVEGVSTQEFTAREINPSTRWRR
jgi:hypothetical protein